MFLSTKDCEGIGDCIKECPTKAIRLINGKAFSCLTCGICYNSCPNNAIFINQYGGYVVDRAKCNACGICMFNCPSNNIHIEDDIVYGICSRCGVCVDTCPTKSRVDGFSLTGEKQRRYLESLNITLPKFEAPIKPKLKEKTREYYGTIHEKCIHCGRCEYYCPTNAIKVEIDQDEGICSECRVCYDVCPTDSIKKFTINHDTCVLCLNCLKTCPHNAIILDDFEVSINKLNHTSPGTLISCINCGLCSEIIKNGSLKKVDGKLRYDPSLDILKNQHKDHMKAINACPVSILKENNELIGINGDSLDDFTLTGFCTSCGTCFRVCDEENAREFIMDKWEGSVSDDCISCGICCEVCPEDAITLNRGSINVNLDKCILCERCAVHCPTESIPRTTLSKKIISDGFNEINQKLCIGCGLCYKICPEDAIIKDNEKYTVNEEKCIYCGACKNACPSNAFLFERNFKDSIEGL